VLAPRADGDSHRVFCDHEDMRAANFANYLSGLVVVQRVLMAVRPSMRRWLEPRNRTAALEINYLHSFLKSQEQLRTVFIVHSERVAQAILLTSGYWISSSSGLGSSSAKVAGSAYDPDAPGGGRLIEEWKWTMFDEILCARKVDAPLMSVSPF
jgi:hypothetical protein